jgi:hypothetical protein
VRSPVPPELCDGLEKEVRDHVADFVQKFAHIKDGSEEDVDAADDDGNDSASSA